LSSSAGHELPSRQECGGRRPRSAPGPAGRAEEGGRPQAGGGASGRGQAADFEQLQAERLDLGEHAVQRGPVGQRPGQHRVAAFTAGSLETALGRYDDASRHLRETRDQTERVAGDWFTVGSRVQLGILAVLRGAVAIVNAAACYLWADAAARK
jgi:hypothetical protein